MTKLKFFENIIYGNFDKREKSFTNLPDIYKKSFRSSRDDLFTYNIMQEKEKNERYWKIIELCEHFAITTKNKEDIPITEFWPQFFNLFMTPKLFDRIPNTWFTEEIGFCFACKHFKGQNKGHHKLLHSLKKRKVIGVFGKCQKYKNTTKIHKDYKFIFKYNNHVMNHFRCRGWQPAKFYEQLLKHRIYKILTEKGVDYMIEEFNVEQERVNVFDFMRVSDNTFDEYY